MDIISDHTPAVLVEAQDFAPWSPALSKVSLPSKEEVNGLHKSAFANPGTREYPLHTKAATFFGILHYRGRGGSDPEIIGRMKAAAVAFDLDEELAKYERFFEVKSQSVKTAGEETIQEKFALELEQNGETLRIYPCRLRDDIVASARQALSDYQTGNLPLPLFAKAARQLVIEAGRVSAPLPSMVLYTGGIRLATPDMARSAIPPAADDATRGAYASLIKAACDADISLEDRDKIAYAWTELDSALTVKRAHTPYEFLWGGFEQAVVAKVASTMVLVETDKQPVLLPIDVFHKIAGEEIRLRQHFGKEEADWLLDIAKQAGSVDDVRISVAAASPARRKLLLDCALFSG